VTPDATRTVTRSLTPAVGSALEVRGITKAFPGVVANDAVSIAFHRGEVHCVLGENGAGKSTLLHILAGMQRPDSGSILVGGERVSLDSPHAAIALGIGAVYQHPWSIPALTVLENMMLGEGKGLRLDPKSAAEALARFGSMLGVEFDPGAEIGRLALGRRQQMEIAKALWSGSTVLMLDEPTAMLTPQGAEELARVLVRLARRGLAIVFVTHKLHEALEVGDRITVLRRGRVTGAWGPDEIAAAGRETMRRRIVEAMFGGGVAPEVQIGRSAHPGLRGRRADAHDRPALELDRLCVEPRRGEVGVRDVTLTVWPGEIVGVAGVDGNGQRELAEAVAGQRSVSSGEIRVGGICVTGDDVSGRMRRGLRYVTDDRIGEGTVPSLSVALNLILKRIGEKPYWRHGRADEKLIEENARELVERFDIRTPGVGARCGTLSGGNLQKVVLARELSSGPAVVVYSKPTHGLDARTTMTVRDRITALAEEGAASLLISSDLDEILDLSHRIAVIFGGRLTGIVDNVPGAEREVGDLMVGGSAR